MPKMKVQYYNNLLVLLVSLTQFLVKGQVSFVLEGTSCETYNATLGCTIGSFTTSAAWKRGDGVVLVVTCSSAGPCSQNSQTIDSTKYSFFGNVSGIYMTTTLPASEQDMNWTCTYSGTDYIYQFDLGCSIILCIGVTNAYAMLVNCNTVPQLVEIFVLLLICCRCLCTQKATINVQTPNKLTKAAYFVNKDNRNRQMQPKKEGKERYSYSCVAYGEQLLTCTFKAAYAELSFSFKISDDLLWADIGQIVILPTTWHVNAGQLQWEGSRWYCDDTPLDIANNPDYEKSDFISLKVKVKQSTIGTYKCEMTVNELEGWLISVSNMRVSGCPWCKPKTFRNIVLAICTAVNLGLCLFSVIYVYCNRSTNGYCVEVYQIFLAALIPQISLDLVILFLIYKLETEKTGKEQSTRCIIICICGCPVTPSDHGNGNQSKTNDGNGQQADSFIPLVNHKKGSLKK